MVRVLIFFTGCLLFVCHVISQAQETPDSIRVKELEEVKVKAFELNRMLREVPAAINYINQRSLNRYNNSNILSALNATPGVRMEERSPGSYRLNIRGSSLRSPFGVRNVKVYFNGIPFTDPGGHTYLNQLGFYNFQTIEIIKGPGSSLYGAGTGGVMLVESFPQKWIPGFNLTQIIGSYNTINSALALNLGSKQIFNRITFQHQESDGYRRHTNLRRDVFSWQTKLRLNGVDEINGFILYGDLYYQTPGALTLAEYDADPKAARPAAGIFPGAEQAKAAIFQKTFFAGTSLQHYFSSQWRNTTAVYGAFTQLRNPTIRNYGRSSEPHVGGRTNFQFEMNTSLINWKWNTGAELQKGFTSVRVYDNVQGNPDALQSDDEINNLQYFLFTQLTAEIKNWIISGGVSMNRLQVKYARLSNTPYQEFSRKYDNELAPRLAVLYKLTNNISAYASVAKGFSPPTTPELSPSGGDINTSLDPEFGWNYEAGIRGTALGSRLYFDVNAFYFGLKNTIVLRRDAGGGDFFINAGSTKQRGIESYTSYRLFKNEKNLSGPSKIWLSHFYHKFNYKDFKQVTIDFSGNKLPSVAPYTAAAGIDLNTRPGFYINLTYYYSDPIPLNDANTAFASAYNLLGARSGYKTSLFQKLKLELFVGADNLFDERYSLGSDINAFGGRYYNAAAGRNYFAGIAIDFFRYTE